MGTWSAAVLGAAMALLMPVPLAVEPAAAAQLPRPPSAPAPPVRDPVQLVRKWYDQYLGRRPDPEGLRNCLRQLQRGETPIGVQAGLLGSDEYYQRNGSNPAGFVTGMYTDVIGQRPPRREVDHWVSRLRRNRGNRQQTAVDFLNWSKGL